MASPDADNFKLTVLSPGGRDLAQYFDELAEPDSPAHPPVNFHGFAACTNGAFHRDVKVALAVLLQPGPGRSPAFFAALWATANARCSSPAYSL